MSLKRFVIKKLSEVINFVPSTTVLFRVEYQLLILQYTVNIKSGLVKRFVQIKKEHAFMPRKFIDVEKNP